MSSAQRGLDDPYSRREGKKSKRKRTYVCILRVVARVKRKKEKKKRMDRSSVRQDKRKKKLSDFGRRRTVPRFNHSDSYSREIFAEIAIGENERFGGKVSALSVEKRRREETARDRRKSGKSGRNKERKCVVRSGTYFLFYVQRGASLFGPRQAEELEECSRHVAP